VRSRRSPARWLAPLALVACAIAAYSVVNASLGSDDPGTTRSTGSKSSTTANNRTVSERSKGSSTRRSRANRTYTVKAGDTLSSIALKTGLTLERIQQLNPQLDSQSLQTGQRVKLSP
jgi:LysM repeat protein